MNDKKTGKVITLSILGVFALILTIVGGSYAYLTASASASNINGQAEGGSTTISVVEKTKSIAKLIPIDMNTTTLTKAALGHGNSGSSFDDTKACKDKNGYSVCKIYEVKVTNGTSYSAKYNIGITSLSGANTPNIDAVLMASNVSVTNAASIKNNATGIASGITVNANSASNSYYIMVFIKNLSAVQSDSGSFSGTITATSTAGNQLVATFS